VLSGTAEYALRAVVYIARRPGGEPVRATDLAQAIAVPRNYLSKILHGLSRAGVLRSTRGKRGGFRLAVPPEDLPLLRVVSVFDDVTARRTCLLGRPECSDRRPCPVHHRWKAASEEIARFFRETTLGDLLA
jgi:Rrf2 family protein